MNISCSCGCGRNLAPSSIKRGKRFIKGHWAKTTAFRRMKKSSIIKPPKDWTSPKGLCECGCGKKTRIASHTDRRAGHYSGYPIRFIYGHSRRLLGEKNGQWKGGRYIDRKNGYIFIRVGKRKYRHEHVLIWEQANGPIPKKHHIHHKNGIKIDNRLENLECLSIGDHNRRHATLRRTHSS